MLDFETHIEIDGDLKNPSLERLCQYHKFTRPTKFNDLDPSPKTTYVCTGHFKTFQEANECADEFMSDLKDLGIKIKRRKIEQILLDRRWD